MTADNEEGWGSVVQKCCFELGRDGGTVAAILKWPQDYRRVGVMTGGYFQSVEPIEAPDGAAFLDRLERAEVEDRARLTVDFLKSVATFATEPEDMEAILARGGGGSGPMSPTFMADAIDAAMASKSIKAHRGELLRACLDVMRNANEFGNARLVDRFRARRSAASRSGRRLATRVSGSTLLLKGMEFDHVIVVDSGEFTEYEWYVAMTRGSKSLTIVSPQKRLVFSGVS